MEFGHRPDHPHRSGCTCGAGLGLLLPWVPSDGGSCFVMTLSQQAEYGKAEVESLVCHHQEWGHGPESPQVGNGVPPAHGCLTWTERVSSSAQTLTLDAKSGLKPF